MNFRGGKRDQFKGHSGKVRRKQLYKSKEKNKETIDKEIYSIDEKYSQFDSSACKLFTDFPLSGKTQEGLRACKYEAPTDIQRESIGLALQGNDILGAAKTGSGKTLAFIIPVIECLFRHKWTQLDGLGALIISPTRELAFQTFEVLKKVGRFHDFSAGLVIGGKPLKEESGRINHTNIVVCTPGRFLQHMDETMYFTADSLKILVLDEADRILDLGFAQTMNGIIDNLPSERQTMLFSATQTRSVKDLARLSLKDPMLVSVHENATESTPSQLEQNYIVCDLHDKLNVLWSFLRNHLKSKILVFLTSCKQVKYVYDSFKRLRPGIPVLALHGGMPQLRRVAAYNQYVWKQNACLFATDIAARGLDFPAVNWVVQLDCPEDANTYIHRAGRTARYEKNGESLLILLPSEEEAMVKQLNDKKIPVEKIKINQKKLHSIQPKLEANCAADPTLKDSAQRAFVSYLKSIFMMSNKKVFDVHALDIEQFARSFGLAIAPKVRFLKREQKRIAEKETTKSQSENKSKSVSAVKDSKPVSRLKSESEDSSSEEDDESDSENADSGNSSEDNIKIGPTSSVNKASSEKLTKVKLETSLTDSSPIKKSKEKSIKDKQNLKTGNIEDNTTVNKSIKVNKEIDRTRSEVKETANKFSSSDSDSAAESDSDDSDGDESEDEAGVKMKDDEDDKKEAEFNFDVDQDDDDDDGGGLFKVKKNVDINKLMGIDEEDEEPAVMVTKKGKKTSKFAEAKKVMKKKMTVNTKVTFDEEGEMELDRFKVPQVDMDTERQDSTGGIVIEMAKKRMQQEDRVDKEIYRQKVKLKHREERHKIRDENRLRKQQQRHGEDEEEGEARLGGDDDDEEEEDRPDPLSFIPDPDVVYGKNDSDDTSEESDFERPSSSKRRKLSRKQEDSDSYSSGMDSDIDMNDEGDDDGDDDDNDDDVLGTEMSLKDQEEFALRLLQGK